MRNISFAATEDQILAQTKDVTRRMGWLKAKAGDILQPVRKGMGIPKGGKAVLLGCPIRIISVRREPLDSISEIEVRREGFAKLPEADFIRIFIELNNCRFNSVITRIEFEYTKPIKKEDQ